MLNSAITDFNIIVAFSEILVEENISDNIRKLRLSGLGSLYGCLKQYEEMGYCEKIIEGIAEKKIKMIKEATTKIVINEILKPHCPYYNGDKFIQNQYSVPEEELIGWSKASLAAPLNSIGIKRYMEVFKTVFPEVDIEY